MKQLAFRLFLVSLLVTLFYSAFSSTSQAQSQEQATLYEAINALDASAVRAALGAGADPNHFKEKGIVSPIDLAVNQLVGVGMSRLFPLLPSSLKEAEERIIAVLEVLFQAGAKISKRDEPILGHPAIQGARKLAKYLLDRGADPNAVEIDGSTPLSLATKYGHPEMVELLIQHGVTPFDSAATAQTQLIGAAGRGDVNAMKQALLSGATVNGRSSTGETALVEAARWGGGGLDAVNFLLSKGADPNLTGRYIGMMSPLHAAVIKHKDEFGDGEGDEIVQSLIDAGAAVSSSKGFEGRTPLHRAAEWSNAIAGKMLLDAGANRAAKDKHGKTPFDYATSAQVKNLLKSYRGGGLLMGRPTGGVKQQQAKVFPQMGHRAVLAVALSPDGRHVLSAGADNTLKLWEVESGRQVRTFVGHEDYVKTMAFSPDGRYVVSGDGKTLKLWEIATGRARLSFGSWGDMPRSVAFSPDGSFILSGGIGMKLWSLDSKKPVQTFAFEKYKKLVEVVAFSPDGRYALSAEHPLDTPEGQPNLKGLGSTVTLWDVATGGKLRTFEGHNSFVVAISFSPDGQHILSVGKDGTFIVWNANTGKQLKRFILEHLDLSSAAFTPDGKHLLTANEGGVDDKSLKPVGGTLKLWDAESGRKVRTFTGHTSGVNSVAFSLDGRYGLSGSNDGTVRLLELVTGEEVHAFKGNVQWVGAVSFLQTDQNTVLSGTLAGGFHLWDVATGRQLQAVTGKEKDVHSLALSPDGEYFLVGVSVLKMFEKVIVKKVSTGQEIGRWSVGIRGSLTAVALSQKGQYAVTGGFNGGVKLWDVPTGKTLWTVAGHTSKVSSVAFSPDGRYVFTAGDIPETLKLWEVKTGKLIKTFGVKKDFFGVGAMAFSPDGRQLLVATLQGLLLLDTETGQQDRVSQKSLGRVYFLTFSSDGRYGLSGGEDREVKLWDLRFKRLLTVFRGHSSPVFSGAFSPDNRFVVTGSADGTTRIWDPSTGIEVARMVGFHDGEWVVMTPEGYYNSSAEGDRYLNVRLGNRVSGIDQYRTTFYKPQVVEAALRLGNSREAIAQTLGGVQPVPTLTTLSTVEPPFLVIRAPKNEAVVDVTTVDLAVHIEDRHRPITSVDFFVSGRKITGAVNRDITVRPKSGQGSSGNFGFSIPQGKQQLDLTIPISLEPGENVVEVVASNGFAEERKSIRLFLKGAQVAGSAEVMLPNLWIFSIGVNDYQDPRIPSLSYGAADAEGIVSMLKQQEGRLFREVHSRLITDHSSIAPTAANILDNLDFLKQAGQHDVVLLFIAGHGINDDRGEFFFLPTDAVIQEDGRIRRSRSISWRDIQSTLDLPSRKLIFVDTCHSADLGGKKKTRGVDNDRLVKEIQSANAVIFTSSRGSELSQESETWGHGIFTHALLDGLNGDADLIKDKKISMKELDAYVSELVPKLTNGAQHPITITPDGYVNFPIAVLD